MIFVVERLCDFFWRLRDFFGGEVACFLCVERVRFVDRLHYFCVKRLRDIVCREFHDFCVCRGLRDFSHSLIQVA